MGTKVFRFALGSIAAPLSGLWRVWTHEDEAHLAVITERDPVHFTAYPTGRWRITVGSAVSKWTRPKEFRPGWTRGPDLLIPFSALPVRPPGDDPYPQEPVSWFPPPAPAHLARFSLLLASPRAEGSQWRPHDAPGTIGLAILPLRTAGALHLNRVDEPLDPESNPLPARSSPPPSATSTGFEVTISADQQGRPSLRVGYLT